MTEAIYIELSVRAEESKKSGHKTSAAGVLQLLGVSLSGYRAYLKRQGSPCKQKLRGAELKKQILAIYNASKQIYGAPKITEELHKLGITTCMRTVSRYMKELGIKAHYCQHRRPITRNSAFSDKLQNTLNQQFNPNEPNTVWCTDITYIWTKEGYVYLSCIMDLYSRKIIAWELSRNLEVSAIIKAINKAKACRKMDRPVIIHTDRGSQYVSEAWREATKRMVRSYSRKGYPYDNACIESFHALIKREWLNRYSLRNFEEAKRRIFEYIDAFYNTLRSHSHCRYVSPNEFERQYRKKSTTTSLLK